jgi:hypothetical protein
MNKLLACQRAFGYRPVIVSVEKPASIGQRSSMGATHQTLDQKLLHINLDSRRQTIPTGPCDNPRL